VAVIRKNGHVVHPTAAAHPAAVPAVQHRPPAALPHSAASVALPHPTAVSIPRTGFTKPVDTTTPGIRPQAHDVAGAASAVGANRFSNANTLGIDNPGLAQQAELAKLGASSNAGAAAQAAAQSVAAQQAASAAQAAQDAAQAAQQAQQGSGSGGGGDSGSGDSGNQDNPFNDPFNQDNSGDLGPTSDLSDMQFGGNEQSESTPSYSGAWSESTPTPGGSAQENTPTPGGDDGDDDDGS
jgi:type II secretory pathway pseudopilin PulG